MIRSAWIPCSWTVGCVLTMTACQGTASGTFVGNPSMTARLADNEVQRAQGGTFEALEVHLTDCEESYVPLGPTTLTFDGSRSSDVVELLVGEHCGLFFVVDQFQVWFDDGGATSKVLADDFDLTIPAEIAADVGERFVLRFGDDAWLSNVAALVGAGESVQIEPGTELEAAFFEGLNNSTVVKVSD